MKVIRFIRIFLLVLIIIGIGLLSTQKLWVPPLVGAILAHETAATTTAAGVPGALPVGRPGKIDTGVEGIVTIGPTCPVQRIPPDPACANKPYPTTLLISSTGRPDIRVTTDAQGYFSRELPPSDYTIRAAAQTMMPRLSPVTFSVTTHNRASLNLVFDSGIR